jgi:TonB-dependent starch-binding outer membrane protein SusC
VRIKNLQLGYTLPKTLLAKVGANSLRIFGSAENLATFTSFRGLDPEKGGDRNDMYPIVKSYSLGVNLSF